MASTPIDLPSPNSDDDGNEYTNISILILCLHGTSYGALYPNMVVRQRKYFIFVYF